jgi:hypothetical protein
VQGGLFRIELNSIDFVIRMWFGAKPATFSRTSIREPVKLIWLLPRVRERHMRAGARGGKHIIMVRI